MDYLVWQADWQDDWCRLGNLQNVEHQAQIHFGWPRAAGFPPDASFEMDPDFPNDTLLTDCLKNSNGELVVSQAVLDFLRREHLPHVEYLPVRVFDHRHRPVEEAYTIVHPVSPVDCLDVEASEPRRSNSIPDVIVRVRHFVIDPKRTDPSRPLFRCAFYTTPKLVHRSLAEKLQKAGFTGCAFVELEDYRG